MPTSLGEFFLSNCFEWLSLTWKFASLSSGWLSFLCTNISQGSVVMHLRCDGIFIYRFAENLLPSLSVKKFGKWLPFGQHTHICFMALFRDHPGKPVSEENFWTLWCKGRLTETDTPTIRLGATASGLTSAHLHHPPFFYRRMPFLPPNQQCQSTEGN